MQMRRPSFRFAIAVIIGSLTLMGAATQAEDAAKLMSQAQQLFGTPPAEAVNAANPVTDEKIELGRKLYFEKRLSKGGEISCNSCHDLAHFGVDGEPTSPGHEGQRGGRNSPTVYNAAFHITQFWDGRSPDVEDQAKGPILNPIEMAMPSAEAVIEVVKGIPEYAPLFKAAFPKDKDPITYDNLAKAIGAFERRLVTPAPFDAFLAGDASALSSDEIEGLSLFVGIGCTTCHNGSVIGGNSYQKMGLVRPYETKDLGRYDVTQKEADKYVFKVPSLRNIAKTGPYFHDGRVADLDEAIALMASHQLGRDLPDRQVEAIAAFLGSLTGDPDAAYIAAP